MLTLIPLRSRGPMRKNVTKQKRKVRVIRRWEDIIRVTTVIVDNPMAGQTLWLTPIHNVIINVIRVSRSLRAEIQP